MNKNLLSSVAIAALATGLYATGGTFTPTSSTIASELGDTSTADLNVSSKIYDGNYTSVMASPSSAQNPTIELKFTSSNAAMTISGTDSNVTLLEQNSTGEFGSGSKIIAVFSSTVNSNTLVFDRAGSGTDVAMTSGKKYKFAEVNGSFSVGDSLSIDDQYVMSPMAAGAMELTSPLGQVSVELSVYENGKDAARDVATANLLSTGTQVTADINSSVFDGQIDSTTGYLSFKSGGNDNADTNESIGFWVNVAAKDTSAAAGTDDVTITLDLVGTGLSTNASAIMSVNEGAAVPCTISADKKGISCLGTNSTTGDGTVAKSDDYNITIDNNGTVINKAVFTYNIAYNFAGTADDYATLKSGSAGEWTYYGYQATIPYLETGTAASFVKLNNDSTQTALVYWDITDSLGCSETAVQGPNVNASTIQDYSATGDILKKRGNIYNVADIVTAANNQTPTDADGASCTIGTKVRAEILVTTTRDKVTGVAMQQLTSGKDRIIPIMTWDAATTDEYKH